MNTKKLAILGACGVFVLIGFFFLSKSIYNRECNEQLKFIGFGENPVEFNDAAFSFKYPMEYIIQTNSEALEAYANKTEEQKKYINHPPMDWRVVSADYLTMTLSPTIRDSYNSLFMRVYRPTRSVDLQPELFVVGRPIERDPITLRESVVTSQENLSVGDLTILRQSYEELGDSDYGRGKIVRYLVGKNGKVFQFEGSQMFPDVRNKKINCRASSEEISTFLGDIVKTVNIY